MPTDTQCAFSLHASVAAEAKHRDRVRNIGHASNYRHVGLYPMIDIMYMRHNAIKFKPQSSLVREISQRGSRGLRTLVVGPGRLNPQ
jgi:hypothetical protein